MNYWLFWSWTRLTLRMVIVAGLILCCSIAIAQDQDQLKEVWQKKVSEETTRFNEFLKSRKTKSYTFSDVDTMLVNGNMRSFNARQVVRRNGSFWLFSKDEDVDTPTRPEYRRNPAQAKVCYGFNSKYAFMLKGSKTGNNWVIHNVTEVTPDLDEGKLFNIGGLRDVVNSKFDSFDRNSVVVLLLSGIKLVKSSDNSTVECRANASNSPQFPAKSVGGSCHPTPH